MCYNSYNPDLDISNLFRGFQKFLAGLSLAKLGVSLSQLLGEFAFVLFANDVTGTGILDDGVAAASLTGTVFSLKIAVEGALLAGAGAAETLGSAKRIAKGLSQNKQTSASSPSPLPPNDDNDDEENLTPEDIDKYNKDVRDQYKNQLDNSTTSTETPWNPSSDPKSGETSKNLHGWRKIIYFLGKTTELFDNIHN